MNIIRAASIMALVAFSHPHANAEGLAADKKAALGKIAPSMAYRYFSGYDENNHNHPAIYAYGYKEDARLVVTGRGFYQEFPMGAWSKAMSAYKALLVSNGYEPGR